MAIAIRWAGEDLHAPDGVILGIVGEDDSGARDLLRQAGGRYLGPDDALNLSPAPVLALDHTLSRHDDVVRARAAASLERLRRIGSTILLASHDGEFLREMCDEIWWVDGGRVAARGDAADVLPQYRRHVARRLADWGRGVSQPLAPAFRRGDGRAELQSIETLDQAGRPAVVWTSGEPVAVRVRMRYSQAVEDPVAGIMIRTRIGFEVFGTNTELEGVRFGPCREGETIAVTFRFACHLCPQQYTLTAASHDPDGVWHDWLEDAIAFSVADSRYTAGVACLRATVSVERV